MNLVDSCGWLEYFADGPRADFFAAAIEQPSELIVSTLSLYEVFKRVSQQRGEGDALQAVAVMMQAIVVDLAPRVAKVSLDLGLPMADSVILATARRHRAALWTQDTHLDGIPGVHFIRPD